MHKVSLYRVAKGILKNDNDVGDALQEAILKAFEKIIQLRKNEYFKLEYNLHWQNK